MSPGELSANTSDGRTRDELREALLHVKTSVLVRHGGSSGALMWQGMLLHALGRFEESNDRLTEAIAEDPVGLQSKTGASAYFRWRGYSRLCLGELLGAESDLRNAMGGKCVNAVDRLYRGVLAWLLGDDETAISYWRRGREIAPGNPALRHCLAWGAATTDRIECRAGLTALEDGRLLANPRTWETELLLAAATAAEGNFSAAIAHASKATEATTVDWQSTCRRQLDRFRSRSVFCWADDRERLRFFLRNESRAGW